MAYIYIYIYIYLMADVLRQMYYGIHITADILADVLRQLYHCKYTTTDTLWQMYYGRYITADIFRHICRGRHIVPDILRQIRADRHIAYHKNGHISANVQRQKISIAVFEPVCWDPSPHGLLSTTLSITRRPKSVVGGLVPLMEVQVFALRAQILT